MDDADPIDDPDIRAGLRLCRILETIALTCMVALCLCAIALAVYLAGGAP